jgi:hypothetical protein
MQHRNTARSAITASLACFATIALAACGDAHIEKLSSGITRDSALKVINEGAGGDSLARVYKQEVYLVDGKQLNVVFYNKDGVKQASDSTLAAKKQTPIVIADGKVVGWGWPSYDSLAKAINIPLKPRS